MRSIYTPVRRLEYDDEWVYKAVIGMKNDLKDEKVSHCHHESWLKAMNKHEISRKLLIWSEESGMKVKVSHFKKDDFAKLFHPF